MVRTNFRLIEGSETEENKVRKTNLLAHARSTDRSGGREWKWGERDGSTIVCVIRSTWLHCLLFVSCCICIFQVNNETMYVLFGSICFFLQISLLQSWFITFTKLKKKDKWEAAKQKWVFFSSSKASRRNDCPRLLAVIMLHQPEPGTVNAVDPSLK